MDRLFKRDFIIVICLLILIEVLGIIYLFTTLEYELIPYRFNTVKSFEFINYFEYYVNERIDILNSINDKFKDSVSGVVETIKGSSDLTFKQRYYAFSHWWLELVYDFIFYGVNIGLNIILCLYMIYIMYVDGEQLQPKETKLSKIFISFINGIRFIFNKIITFIKYILNLIKEYKLIFISALVIFFVPFWLRLALEIIIGIISYLLAVIKLEAITWFFNFFKFAIVLLVPMFWNLPIAIKILMWISLYFIFAFNSANKKLRKNFESIKCFTRFDTCQTNLVNGPPGTGKTRLITFLGLIAEENYIEDLEDILHSIEKANPTFNYAALDYKIENNLLCHNDFIEHEDYIKIWCYLNGRESYIISNYAILDVYFGNYSKILKNTDLEFSMTYDDIQYGLEEYTVFCISELDKYVNSHDKSKSYYQNGVNAFFSMVSHVLDRHCKIFCDYQLKDQVPLMIRGNAEKQFRIYDNKYKLPLLLIPISFVISLLSNFFNNMSIRYSYRKEKLYKRSNRYKFRQRKRYDYSLFLSIVLHLASFFETLEAYMRSYSYTKMYLQEMENDGEVVGKVKLNLNEIDSNYQGQRLYNSVCFKSIYDSKRNCRFNELDSWTSLDSSEEELKKCGMFNNVL